MISDHYMKLVKDSILDERSFAGAVFSGRRRGRVVSWRRVTVRPVLIRNKRHIQFSYFDDKKDITKNYAGSQVAEKVEELLALPFGNIHLQSTDQSVQLQVTRKGKVFVHRHRVSDRGKVPSLQHDRRKNLLLPMGKPDPFLVTIGVMTQEGRVRAHTQKKFRQINEFLRLVVEAGVAELETSPLRIVDCGCGSAHLTFAVYHYLTHILHLPVHLTGIDVNRELIERRSEQSHQLGWRDLTFQAIRIADYQPTVPPVMVLALHACDTATDEALSQAVRWGCEIVFVAPCCHHDLQRQLDQQPHPQQVGAVFRHGILKERLGDILTDTFRALILRIMGYRTDVFEFVSAEHTDKNLMIRAVKAARPGNPTAIQEYRDLKQFCQVKPYLEQLLGKQLLKLL